MLDFGNLHNGTLRKIGATKMHFLLQEVGLQAGDRELRLAQLLEEAVEEVASESGSSLSLQPPDPPVHGECRDRAARSRNWVATLQTEYFLEDGAEVSAEAIAAVNTVAEEIYTQLESLDQLRYICWATEVAPTTGRIHGQMYLQLKSRQRFSFVNARFPRTAYIAMAIADAEKNYAYVRGPYEKDGKTKPYNESFEERGTMVTMRGERTDLREVHDMILDGASYPEVLYQYFPAVSKCHVVARELISQVETRNAKESMRSNMEYESLREWQRYFVDELKEKELEYRHVYWVYDTVGNVGKSYLARYFMVHFDALIFSGGKISDMMYGYNGQGVVVFDLSRTMAPGDDNRGPVDAVYAMIERLKNGFMYSTKYSSVQKVFAPPHIVVFSNFAPDRAKLSLDRWRVTEIAKETDWSTDSPVERLVMKHV